MRLFVLLLSLLATPASAECVVLLHGLARSDLSFAMMEEVLERAGYDTISPDYPSTEATIAHLAADAIPPALDACGDQKVHFVTHSMGGILVRQFLSENTIPNLGHVVMMGPPNHGSELVDELAEWQPFYWLNGPAGLELGTGPDSTPNLLPGADYSLGVIAGNKTINIVYSNLIPGEDDGKVSVASTYLDGMRGHITLPVTHTFMMNNPLTVAQVLSFLRHGRFQPGLTVAEVLADAVGLD